MKDEVSSKQFITRLAIIVCVVFGVIFCVILSFNYFTPYGTGGLQQEPDESKIVSLNDTFNISFSTQYSNLNKCLVNDIDTNDVESYEPGLILIYYFEGNFTDSSNMTEFIQNWTFHADRIGIVNLYYVNGDYGDIESIGYHYDYWVRIEVVN